MTETAPSRPPPDSPESLLESHIAGDDGAFGKLTARYGTRLFSFLERMTGDARQAEDAFQQTFVNAAKNARSFDRRESSFSVRLYRIANAALDEVRRRTRRSEEFAGEGAVANALGRIPGEQREAFLLKEEGDLPFGEIGAVLGCGRETAKSRFRLAVNALAPLLGLENAGQTGQRDGDRNPKDSGHLPDPLDYLYEELPPDQMLEARKHLAACSSCRADMRAVREMVKTYRQAGKPAVPAGLAARAVRVALEEAKNEKARKTAAPLPAIPPAAQAQIPPPAPAATAQIPTAHTPPAQPNPVPPHPPSASSPPSPPPPPNMSGMRGVNSWDQPDPIDLDREFARLKEEVLREIPKGWRTWLFHPAWTVAASVIFICAVLIHLSPRLNQTETSRISSAPAPAIRDDAARDGDVARRIRDRERLPSSRPRELDDAVPATPVPAPILETAAVMSETIPDIPPASEPESEPASASAPGPAPESMSEPEAAVEPPVESAVEPVDRAVVEPAAEPAVKPLPASAIPAAPAEEERDAVFAAPVPPPEVRLPRPAPAPELPVGATPPELLESLGEKTKALAESEEPGVVIWENPDAASVPQLIERPPAYDPAERIQSLAILAGMQMASGEFVDAWQTVGLLENYDPAAAEALGATLRDLEQAAKAKAEEEAREIAPPVVEPEPESEPKAIPEPEPEIIPEPEPAPASEPEPAIEPGPVFELNPVPESVLVFESAPAAVYAPMVPVMIIPAPTPRARPAAPARPFTTDPYFRDY